jgi:hypothetical protein
LRAEEEEEAKEKLDNQVGSIGACCLLHARVLLGLSFDPEDENNMYRKVGFISSDYAVIYRKNRSLNKTAARTSNHVKDVISVGADLP